MLDSELIFHFLMFIPLLIVLITTTINAIFGPFLNRIKIVSSEKELPLISLLIPARNEERNIAKAIECAINQTYENLEILILDDNSSDRTAEIVENYEKKNPQIKLIKNTQEPPAGWLGKPRACDILQSEAKGEILIFTDADNRFEADAIAKSYFAIKKYHLDMLSVFPQQLVNTYWEKLIVPMIDVFLYSFYFLWSGYYFKSPALAAANGQWIAVKAKSYRKVGGHSAVKDKIIEDQKLCILFKENGFKILTFAGKGIIFGEMYSTFSEIYSGLSKNLSALVANNLAVLFLIVSFMLWGVIAGLIFAIQGELWLALISFASMILWRTIHSFSFGYSVLFSAIFHIPSSVFFFIIGLNSLLKAGKGKLEWKGRKV